MEESIQMYRIAPVPVADTIEQGVSNKDLEDTKTTRWALGAASPDRKYSRIREGHGVHCTHGVEKVERSTCPSPSVSLPRSPRKHDGNETP